VAARRSRRNHNRVTTVGLKYPEHIRCRDHRTPPVDVHAYRLLLSDNDSTQH
jgi:hypothetical protein